MLKLTKPQPAEEPADEPRLRGTIRGWREGVT